MFTPTRSANRSLVVCALLAVSVALLAGCAPSTKEMRATGIEQYRDRQYVESMATFRHLLEISPSDAQANYYMGLNYRENAARKFAGGDVTAARRELDTGIVYFTQAIKSWPNYMAAVSAKTEALETRGKYEEALNVAERVADNNRGVAEHFAFLGDEYRDHGDYDNALRAYNTALASDSNCAKAHAGMAKLYARIGETSLAAEASRKANQLDRGEQVIPEEVPGQARPVSHTPR